MTGDNPKGISASRPADIDETRVDDRTAARGSHLDVRRVGSGYGEGAASNPNFNPLDIASGYGKRRIDPAVSHRTRTRTSLHRGKNQP
jgi:hypothetical protein